jgi:hypothetical protein
MNVFVSNRKTCFLNLSLSTKIVEKMSLSTKIVKKFNQQRHFFYYFSQQRSFLKNMCVYYMFHICHKSSKITYGANWGWGNGEANI